MKKNRQMRVLQKLFICMVSLSAILCVGAWIYAQPIKKAQKTGVITPPIQTPGLNALAGRSGVLKKLDQDAILLQKMSNSRPVKTGTLSALGSNTIAVGRNKTLSLNLIAQKTFEEQDLLRTQLLSGQANTGVLAESPEVLTEVYEFPDSYAIVKSTSFIVTDPARLTQISPLCRKFIKTPSSVNRISVSSLKAENLSGFRKYIQNDIPGLSVKNPLKNASKQGEDALLKAVAEGKGQYEVIDTLIVPKNPYPEINGQVQFPFQTQYLNAITSRPSDEEDSAQLAVEKPSIQENGTALFHTEYLAGFTKGNAWEWERRWNYPSGFLRISLGARYGIGFRIPIDVNGKLSPVEVLTKDVVDKPTRLKTGLKVNTIDADAEFYRKAGVPRNLIFDGKEVVFEAEFGYGYKLRALWTDLLYRRFSYFGINESQNFDPPLGRENIGPVIAIDPDITRTRLNFNVIDGYAQAGIRFSGDGTVKLDYEPYLGSQRLPKKHLSFNSAREKNVEVDLPPLRGSGSNLEMAYGFNLGNPSYTIDLTLTPVVRVNVSIDVDWLSKHFDTGWIDLNALSIDIGSISFGRHRGTRKNYKFSDGKKKFQKINDWSGEVKNGDIIAIQSVQNGRYIRGGLGFIECKLGAVSNAAHVWEAFQLQELGVGKIALQSIKNAQYVRAGVGDNSRLAATSPRASVWETFKLIPLQNGKVAIQCVKNGKYLRVNTDNEHLITAQSTGIGPAETFKLWPAPEAVNELPVTPSKDKIIALECVKTGKYVRAGLEARSMLGAISPRIDIWEAFKLIDLGEGKAALQSMKNKKYVAISYNIPNFEIMALSRDIGNDETFRMRRLNDGTIAFQSVALNRYVRAGIGQDSHLGAKSATPGDWEKFRLHTIPQAQSTIRSQWQTQQQGRNVSSTNHASSSRGDSRETRTAGGTQSTAPSTSAPSSAGNNNWRRVVDQTQQTPAYSGSQIQLKPVVTNAPVSTSPPAKKPKTISSTKAPVLSLQQEKVPDKSVSPVILRARTASPSVSKPVSIQKQTSAVPPISATKNPASKTETTDKNTSASSPNYSLKPVLLNPTVHPLSIKSFKTKLDTTSTGSNSGTQ